VQLAWEEWDTGTNRDGQGQTGTLFSLEGRNPLRPQRRQGIAALQRYALHPDTDIFRRSGNNPFTMMIAITMMITITIMIMIMN